VRPLAHPSQQVQAGRVLPPMEVPGPASLLRKVPVRARHGENAPDAKDPRAPTKPQRQTTPYRASQTRQCLIHIHCMLLSSFFLFLQLSRFVTNRDLGLLDSRVSD